MYCMNCGVQLPDTARFCMQCGAAQGATDPPPPPEPEQWEYCEIVIRRDSVFLRGDHYVAQATGPKGPRDIARQRAFMGKGEAPGVMNSGLVRQMVGKLTKEGWEPQPNGKTWYNFRFRKRWDG